MSSEPGFWLLHKEWVTGRTCETCNDKRAVGANPKERQWKTTKYQNLANLSALTEQQALCFSLSWR